MFTATSSSVVLAGLSQKTTWPTCDSFGAVPCACVPPSAPDAPGGTGMTAATAVRAASASAPANATHLRPDALPISRDCPTRQPPMGAAQSAKAGMTSVPMSSIVCMTDSWETL